MPVQVTLGGDRLGSGNKQKVSMHDYGMSSFNLEQDWKSSMAPGVLYPFIKMVGTNHGTFDIDLDTFVRTLPTKGPLFGSFKLQLDLFSVPFRLYQGILHNNPTKIGMKMNQVYLPKLVLTTKDGKGVKRVSGSTEETRQVNESALLKYLGLSGLGTSKDWATQDKVIMRKINAVPALAYYDIFKCYYSNKQEQKAYVITPGNIRTEEETQINSAYTINNLGTIVDMAVGEEIQYPTNILNEIIYAKINGVKDLENIKIAIAGYDEDNVEQDGEEETLKDWLEVEPTIVSAEWVEPIPGNRNSNLKITINGENMISQYNDDGEPWYKYTYKISINNSRTEYTADIQLSSFDLENIDEMRQRLLSANELGQEFLIYDTSEEVQPYLTLIRRTTDDITYNAFTMNGLCVKTYQSDLFNNWLDSEWIDGEEGIAALTAINTATGAFIIDSFIFAEKLYDVYNRIAAGGGTYEDWQEAVYGEGAIRKCETPMYIGGMAAEIMFEEVISNSETLVNNDFQPLGSLGGKGTQVGQRGGKNIHVKCDEPGYIMGIVSITPRISYSQGNDWDLTELDTLDDLHKPGLDGIGFQDLIVEQMAWWNTKVDNTGAIISRSSAGKQTAWINYQTATDKCFGDFAKGTDGYSFMVLNRNYEMTEVSGVPSGVKDITTYIDPSKFNYAFAVNDLAAQNFWVQIHSKVVARRKMGAQQIPNL